MNKVTQLERAQIIEWCINEAIANPVITGQMELAAALKNHQSSISNERCRWYATRAMRVMRNPKHALHQEFMEKFG